MPSDPVLSETELPAIDRVVDDLRALVLAGRFAADSRLGEEAAAEALGVSRTPVRYALATLEQEGLLRRLPRRGYRVRSFTIAEVTDAIEVRGELEGMAARQLAERGLPERILADIETLVRESEAIVGKKQLIHADRQSWADLNLQFHDHLVHATGNVGLITAYEQVKRIPLVSPRAMLFDTGNIELSRAQLTRAQDDHARVMDAIRARRSQRAGEIMRDHSIRSGDNKRRNFHAVLSNEMLVADLGAALIVSTSPSR
jgi:GntR family transcriptional regulator of vanillate catabolism